jgi:hypothetical protein
MSIKYQLVLIYFILFSIYFIDIRNTPKCYEKRAFYKIEFEKLAKIEEQKSQETDYKVKFYLKKDVIIDPITQLKWDTSGNYPKLNYDEAQKYCSSLTLNNTNTWRIPTYKELENLSSEGHFNIYKEYREGKKMKFIINKYEQSFIKKSIDKKIEKNIDDKDVFFWSSSHGEDFMKIKPDPNWYWGVNFTKQYGDYFFESEKNYAICVSNGKK